MLLQIPVRVPDQRDPLGMLVAGHRRQLSRLRSLGAAGARLLDPDVELREQARGVLVGELGFFRHAADECFREEAELLFPLLRARSPEDTELASACASLERDRDRAAAHHAELSVHALALLHANGHEENSRALAAVAGELELLHRAHLERLEAQIFPRAEALLDAPALRELGDRMFEGGPLSVANGEPSYHAPAAGLP